MIRFFKIPVLLISATLFSSQALAALPGQYKWDAWIDAKNYYGQFDTNASFSTPLVLKNASINNSLDSFHNSTYDIYQKINSLEDQLRPQVKDAVNNALGQDFKDFSLDVYGPMTLKVEGWQDGVAKVTLSGFNVKSVIKAKSFYVVDSKVTLTKDNVTVSAKFDYLTGKIYDAVFQGNFNLDYDAGFWGKIIPFLEDFAENKLKKGVNDAVKNKLAAVSVSGLWGLDQALPDNLPGGVDMKWKLEQMLSGMITGQYISLTLQDLPYTPTANAYLCYEPGKFVITKEVARLSLSGNQFFRVVRDVTQGCKWNFNSGQQPDY